MKGFVIAGTGSGSGKTTVSLALMSWLNSKNYKVAPFKVGPDFIDPIHHRNATGLFSRNLDGWMLEKEYNLNTFFKNTAEADVAVVEGVMGLYDGFSGKSEKGSTAELAKCLGLPVILVVNARSMARSAAAVVYGFENFDKDLNFAGIIFNGLGSKNHLRYLTDAVLDITDIPVLGGILRNDEIIMPERHLGLVTSDEFQAGDFYTKLSGIINESIDTETLLKQVEIQYTPKSLKTKVEKSVNKTVRIAVARDKAFCFYYPENIEELENSGAEIVYFSPVKDSKLPDNIGGIYFGGGYPELFAKELSTNKSLLDDVKKASQSGMPIFGECGGFMYLCSGLTDNYGNKFAMCGCYPFETRMLTKLKLLGYREIYVDDKSPFGNEARVIKGHEFHYSEIIDVPENYKTSFYVKPGIGNNLKNEGYTINNTIAGYTHLHFGSNPQFAQSFVEKCRNYGRD